MIKEIPLNGGLKTYPDPEDIGLDGCTVLQNFDIHVPGKITSRGHFGDRATASSYIDRIIRWVAPNGTTYWVWADLTNDLIYYASPAEADTTWSTSSSLANSSTEVRLYNYADFLRLANGRDNEPRIIQYIDREFFWGLWRASDENHYYSDDGNGVGGFKIDTVTPKLPPYNFDKSPSGMTSNPGTISYGKGLDFKNYTYYYKMAPVYDGNQEGLLSEIFTDSSNVDSTTTHKGLFFRLDFNDLVTNWNPRLTGINFYRSTAPGGPYYKILSTSTLGNTDPTLKHGAGSVSNVIYVETVPFTSNSEQDKDIWIDGTTYNVVNNSTSQLILNPALSDNIWDEYFYLLPDGATVTVPDISTGWTSTDDTSSEPALDADHIVITSGSNFAYGSRNAGVNFNLSYYQGSTYGLVYKWLGSLAEGTYNLKCFLNPNYNFGSGGSVEIGYATSVTTDRTLMNSNFTSLQTTSAGGQTTSKNNSSDWEAVGGSFTNSSGASQTYYVVFKITGANYQNSEYVLIDEMILTESTIATYKGYGGKDTLISGSLNLDRTDGRKDNIVHVYKEGEDPTTYGQNYTPEIKRITNNTDDAVKLGSDLSADYQTGTGESVHYFMNPNYIWRKKTSGDDFYLYIYDRDLSDGASHPLEGVSNIDVNYKYSQFLDGRNYVANVALDPDGENEIHKNWIIFSELNQPDVLPVSNYIEVQDLQGGEITGLGKMMGDLFVFMEKGIYRIQIPSTDPTSWALIESEENIGCTAPDSIIEVEGQLYFAGTDHIYKLDANFQAVPIDMDILDVWQGTTSKSSTRLTYEPKNSRILCQFGTSDDTIYCYHILLNKWTKWAFTGTQPRSDNIAISEDMDIYIVNNGATSYIYDNNITQTMDYYDELGVVTQKDTGWIKLADLDNTGFLRRLNIKYSATAPIGTVTTNLKVYKDGSSTPTATKTITADEDVTGKSKSFRIGIRANRIKIGVEATTAYDAASTNHQTFTLERLELELD